MTAIEWEGRPVRFVRRRIEEDVFVDAVRIGEIVTEDRWCRWEHVDGPSGFKTNRTEAYMALIAAHDRSLEAFATPPTEPK